MNRFLTPFSPLIGLGRDRWLTHFALLLFNLGGLYLAHSYVPNAGLDYVLTIGCGYLSLILIVATLLVGPLTLLRQRHNPVNLDLRRDIGIWAGITGVVHVFFGLQVRSLIGVIGYFLRKTTNGYVLLTTRFGIANDIGLLATIILILLLLTSNTLSLRRLRGPRWKMLQRLNYVLVALVLLHTFLYQMVSRREPPFRTATVILTLVLLVGQFVGMQAYRAHSARQQRRHGLSASD